MKGTKFRLTPILNKDDIPKIWENIFNQIILKLKNRHKLRSDICDEVKVILDRFFLERKYRILLRPKRNSSLVEFKKIEKEVQHLRRSFIFCPLDKAASNYGKICQRLYFHIIQTVIECMNTNYISQHGLEVNMLLRNTLIFFVVIYWNLVKKAQSL